MIDCVKKIVFEKKYDKYMIGIAVQDLDFPKQIYHKMITLVK